MKITLGYGSGFQSVDVPDRNIVSVLGANNVRTKYRDEAAVEHALMNPIGSPRLKDIVKPRQSIVIITSDITRPMPTAKVMPLLLDELYESGASADDIKLVFALGSHRHHTEEEMRKLAGERAWSEITCVDSDPDDCVNLGMTSRGTPIEITREVACADVRICLGNVEYHYFAGYSGGAKALMPGCSTPAAISVNHSMMIDPRCRTGNALDNPLREDLEEAASIVGIDFILNVVLDEDKDIVYACAGDYVKAHRDGCRFLDSMYSVRIPMKADIVIAANSGAPKDASLYQNQKALDNASRAVRAGGTVILVGECSEGLGSKVFEDWMNEAAKPEELIERLRNGFVLGGHKATAIAMVLEKARIYLVSEMSDDEVRNCFMEPYGTVQDAFDHAFGRYGEEATVIVMPYGGTTLPTIMK